MGGVIITLTRRMGKPMYRLSQTCCCLMSLGGLFDGRHLCTEESFTGNLGLCYGNFFAVSIVVLSP